MASEGGVIVQAARGVKIERPLPKAKKKSGAEEATGDEKGESVEDLGMGDESSDLQSSCAVVDTAKEDTPAGDSSSHSGSSCEDLKKPRKGGEPATGEGAATGDRTATGDGPAPGDALPQRRGHRTRPPIYDNEISTSQTTRGSPM